MNPHKSNIRLLYLNANGILNKIHEIYTFMSQNSVDIACVCETFLKPSINLNQHPNFIIHRHDRDDGHKKGGVLIIVNRSIPHQLLPRLQCNLIENINIEVSTSRSKIIFSSCYLPGGCNTQQINGHFKSDVTTITRRRTRFYAMGDFNAKHRYWGCNRANNAGKILYDEFCRQDFDIVYPQEHSYHPFDLNRASSTLDICLTNSDLQTSDLTTHHFGSDHNGIMFDINLDSDLTTNSTNGRPCFRKADWKLYQSVINRELIDMDYDVNTVDSTEHIDELIDKFTSMMQYAQSQAVPIITPSKFALELTPEILAKIQERSTMERRCQRSQVFCRKIFFKWQVNKLQKEITHEINNLRNANWSNYLEKIPTDDNYRKLWQTSKFLKNRCRKLPPLRTGSRRYVTPQEKADIIAEIFSKVHKNPLEASNPQFTQQIEDERVQITAEQVEPGEIDTPSLSEIEGYVKRLKNSKAPGLDHIHNTLLKHLPPNGMEFLTYIISACFKFCYFPQKWKHATITPIHKPGKHANDPSSYRPISLLSAISKILERAILTRIHFHLEDNSIIPIDQCGFVHGKSTSHQLHRIKSHIKQNLELKSSTGMLLVDVEKAFDRVWIAALIHKMRIFQFPMYLIKIINSFLTNRSFSVRVEGKFSKTYQIPFGVPQGAVCSPTLYNIYTADSPDPAPCQRGLFADDTTFFVSSPLKTVITKNLRQTMTNNLAYYEKWKIKLNLDKSRAKFFTRRRTKEIPLRPLRIQHNSTRWSQEPIKYLGVLLDKQLTFKEHHDYVLDKTNAAIKILYPLINRRSKLNVKNKLLLYKVALRPIMTYAAPVIYSCAKIHTQKLQVTQNKILRMIYDTPYNTRITTLHEMAGLETIEEFTHRLHDNFLRKL